MAAARQRAETAQKRAETVIVQKRNGLRAELAKLEAEAKQIENEAAIASETERTLAEQELQTLRGELEKLRLNCDVVLPAEATRKANELRARGQAAPTIENGKAVAEALRLVSREWEAAGEFGREVYLLQQLRTMVSAAVSRVSASEVVGLHVVASSDEDPLGDAASMYPAAVLRVLLETGKALGVDVGALLAQRPTGLPAGRGS
jgi:flotillin